MASTPTVVESKNDYGNGLGYELQRLVWDGGTTTGTITPSSASGISRITEWDVLNITGARAVQVVKSYSSSADKEILTLTGTANDSFDVIVKGRVA